MTKRFFWLFFWCFTVLALFLRVYRLTDFPPSLYWEEVALGYDAYSILQTGKDHHGNPFPLVAFESFGDWKPSLYFYALVPFIKMFGLTAWAVRLPAVISGLAIVLGVGVLARFFASTERDKNNLQLIAMFVTAISPWAIQFSRAGWEVSLATSLITWGVVTFLVATETKKNNWLLMVSAVLLVLSTYTYHAARVIGPFLGVGLGFWWVSQRGLKHVSALVPVTAVAGVLLIPLILSFGSQTTNQRFAETSIFSDLTVIQRSNELKERAGNSLFSRVMYHRYLLFGREMLINGLSHFHPNFLFMTGDSNSRHSIQFMGQLYHLETLFLFLGVVVLLTQWNPRFGLLCVWLIIGLLPASMTKATPHALRILPTLPVFMLLITLGIRHAVEVLPKRLTHLTLLVIVMIYMAELSLFWRFYSAIYPKVYADQWQYGYQEMVRVMSEVKRNNPDKPIYITREQGRPAMYYWFFTATDPRLVQESNAVAKKDQGEFLTFENIKFVNSVQEITEPHAFAASSETQKNSLPANSTVLYEVKDLRGAVVWVLYEVHKL